MKPMGWPSWATWVLAGVGSAAAAAGAGVGISYLTKEKLMTDATEVSDAITFDEAVDEDQTEIEFF